MHTGQLPARYAARRRWALLGAVVALATSVAASAQAAPTSPTSSTERRAAAGSVTVAAPGAGPSASVTVSRATDLVNQTVIVSWSGFVPSSASRLDNAGDALDVNTQNPVRVYQCRGTDPASSSECYGAPGFRGVEATAETAAVPPVPGFTYPGQTDPYNTTPDGPANWQDSVTRTDGTGEVAIQLFTQRESAGLGCDADVACSIVVVPNYGQPQGATEDLMDAPWAWARRTVVPLKFLPLETACPLMGEALRMEGTPFIAHALASWRSRTCTLSKDPVRIDYTALGEPQVRSDLAAGMTDAGLIVDPIEAAEGSEDSASSVVLAPVAVTGLVVGFQIDDAEGRPVQDLKLNARLVAKLITASYRSGADPAVITNPVNIFRDPEFLELNPGVAWPGGAPGNHVLLLGDLSDSTLALTRWIAADKDAAAFIAGTPDPYGMTVNTHYKDVALPFASYPVLDELLSQTFEPIQELDAVARQLSLARFPGAVTSVENGVTVVTKPPRQNPGRREVIGIVDAAAAARFQLTTASLQNSSGAFVKPSDASFAAAIKSAPVGDDGVTRAVDHEVKDAAAYPLTLQVTGAFSAAAPKKVRTDIADFLTYVAGNGQIPGEELGQLPAGHAPLPKALLKQVDAARTAILAGAPTEPAEEETAGEGDGDGTTVGDGSGSNGSGDSGVTGGGTVTPVAEEAKPEKSDKPTKTPEAALTEDEITTLSVASQPASQPLLLMPVLLGFALLSLALARLLVHLARTGRGPQWLRR